jgi:hypothetical protein
MHILDRKWYVSWLKRRQGVAAALLCAALVLAACGGGSDDSTADDEDRRFVTDRPTASATIVTTPTEVVAITELPASFTWSSMMCSRCTTPMRVSLLRWPCRVG